jgi:hypothetical protein
MTRLDDTYDPVEHHELLRIDAVLTEVHTSYPYRYIWVCHCGSVRGWDYQGRDLTTEQAARVEHRKHREWELSNV